MKAESGVQMKGVSHNHRQWGEFSNFDKGLYRPS